MSATFETAPGLLMRAAQRIPSILEKYLAETAENVAAQLEGAMTEGHLRYTGELADSVGSSSEGLTAAVGFSSTSRNHEIYANTSSGAPPLGGSDAHSPRGDWAMRRNGSLVGEAAYRIERDMKLVIADVIVQELTW